LNVRPGNYGLSPDQLRDFLQGYHASVSFADAQVGKLLDALDRFDLTRRTVVVFFSDHGYLLGEHGGQWQKMSLFEQSARVPLMIRVPGGANAGGMSTKPVELVDVYPTVADLCGVPYSGCEGASVRPLLQDPASAAWTKPALTMVTRAAQARAAAGAANPAAGVTNRQPAGGAPRQQRFGRSIRTERYRYTEWARGELGAELYDHQNDPNEWKNLAELPEHAALRAELHALLLKHQPTAAAASR
jgi:uncharacterized sulfatase